MKDAVFTYHDELIKISVKNQINLTDTSIEAEVIVDDEQTYKIIKKDGVSTPADQNYMPAPALLLLINKCL